MRTLAASVAYIIMNGWLIMKQKLTEVRIRQDIIWKVLKDADALDRSRFGGRGCDKSYLRLGIYQSTVGQNILGLTSYLPKWTQNMLWDYPYSEIVNIIKKLQGTVSEPLQIDSGDPDVIESALRI